MNALHQTRLVIALGLTAAVLAGIGSVAARSIDPVAPVEGTTAHVVWALSAALLQLLAQCWILLFSAGSLRLLARRGAPAPATQRILLVSAPVVVVALTSITVWFGIQGFTRGPGSAFHGELGWGTCGVSVAALLVEWWALEGMDRRMTEADRTGGEAPAAAGHSL